MAKSYSDKLRSPNWQRKRLEILNKSNFTCELCGDKETELHIHHKSYEKGKDVWEYEDDNFSCLCKDCHHIVESLKKLATPFTVHSVAKYHIDDRIEMNCLVKDSDGILCMLCSRHNESCCAWSLATMIMPEDLKRIIQIYNSNGQ